MVKLTWSKIAAELSKNYVEENTCKICGREIEESDNRLRTLLNIYKHFKEQHPHIVEKVKEKLRQEVIEQETAR